MSLVILLFLWHVPRRIIPILTIPVSVLLSFIPLPLMGITANIMSLGGIAIADRRAGGRRDRRGGADATRSWTTGSAAAATGTSRRSSSAGVQEVGAGESSSRCW